MESDFRQAMDFVFRWEGGYGNDPNDPGGETHFGISKRAYPHLDIKNLTKEEAEAIYHEDYWNKAKCPELSYPLDMVVFDTAVNLGVGRALGFLQKTHRVEVYLLLRLKHYVELPTAKFYINGWTRRLVSLWNEVTG
jgi:lysozyme family protein